MFGHKFFVTLQRCVNEVEIEMATPLVSQDIVIKECHQRGKIEDDEYETWEIEFKGFRAFEDYIERGL
ncbi:UNVERIFIED_CONTAM: hypothetical protein HDU68_006451, partial [Siphonaria sp. JEL0065]